MQIIVKSPDGTTTPLTVNGEDTVGRIRSRIQDLRQDHRSGVRLVFAGAHLDDERSLSSYNIQEGSVVFAMEHHRGLMNIFVKDLTGEVASLKVNDSDTAEAVRFKTYDALGIPHTQEGQLILAGKQLDNVHTLSDYNVHPDSTLHLVLRLSDEVQITVEPLDSKEFVMNVARP